jgi:hypothetical protein
MHLAEANIGHRYRIIHRQTALALATDNAGKQPAHAVLKPADSASTWYISRDEDDAAAAYSIRPTEYLSLFLDGGDFDFSTSWTGEQALLLPRFGKELSQRWSLEKQALNGWLIRSEGAQAVLGINAEVSQSQAGSSTAAERYATVQTTRIDPGLRETQIWQFESVRTSLPSGLPTRSPSF